MGEKCSQQVIPVNIVEFSETFNLYYSGRFSEKTLDKIDDFIEHFEKYGLFGNPQYNYPSWVGKVSPSWNVPKTYPNYIKIKDYAKKHNLWHAHIGDPLFMDTPHGKYKVSDWVLHFQLISKNHIKLLELGYHNPMELPSI